MGERSVVRVQIAAVQGPAQSHREMSTVAGFRETWKMVRPTVRRFRETSLLEVRIFEKFC